MSDGTLLDAIAREMQTGVLVLDGAGRVLYVNPSFTGSFPVRGDLSGKDISEVMGDTELLKAVKGFLPKALTVSPAPPAASPAIPAETIEINEGERVFKVRLVPLTESGGFSLILFLQEITEEKRVEAIKKDFVANVSHELRTPLASIKGYSETLLDGGLDDRKTLKEFLRVIDRHATRMSRLIDDLLTLSTIESEQISVVKESLDIKELVSSTVSGLEKEAKDKGIRLGASFKKGLPPVLGDRDRLEQVMVNLLDNAIKYTPSGGQISVAVSNSDGEVRVDVKDTGIGIPEKDMPRIFERFYRIDKARSRELGGTGLGLAIVKHIIQGHNGKVWVESTPERGSKFSFTLKAAP